ncbi:MAG: peptidylprolyl isomerase [Actinomycetia bacterium]|nr:peptidylprolyl isomerase [Actinomycetes bacterium]
MRLSRIFALTLAVGLVAAACSSSSDGADTAVPSTVPLLAVPTNYVGYLRQPTACDAQQPEPAVDMKFDAPQDIGVTGLATISLNTSCGTIDIAVDPSSAPETVNSFVFLAESGYFDGTVSHRIVPGFMMQAGDPTATGLGGPGYTVPDEYPDEPTYLRGTVAMANAGPGTTGSQFFILFGDAQWLPPTFTIFGQVVDGFDTLDRIEQIPLGRGPNSADPEPSTPLETLYIESVSITG